MTSDDIKKIPGRTLPLFRPVRRPAPPPLVVPPIDLATDAPEEQDARPTIPLRPLDLLHVR